MTQKVVLCILDGWGHAPHAKDNAISNAVHPNYDKLLKEYPNSLLEASAEFVGLPAGQVGNSEVGHLTIGAGRRIYQDLPKIDNAMATGQMWDKPAILRLIADHGQGQGVVHLVGLASDGGVHGSIHHLIAIARHLEEKGCQVFVHAIIDGRDTAPKSALAFLDMLTDAGLYIASVSGRFYAMDRDNRAERTTLARDAIIGISDEKFTSAQDYVKACYDRGVTDEFVPPAVFEAYEGIAPGDSLIFTNYRADRMRQIVNVLLDLDKKHPLIDFKNVVVMRPYSAEIAAKTQVIFPSDEIKNTLGEVLAKNGLAQLRVAETEKYAHVTYFFNGGNETPNMQEDRILVPSPKVTTYDMKPEMSSYEITHHVVDAIESAQYDFICVNYASPDMVGHTGDFKASVKAVETIDHCLQGLTESALRMGYVVVITADHGNVEDMFDDETNMVLTAHTLNKVPLLVVSRKKYQLQDGELADVAPTILDIMNMAQPSEMTGKSLVIS